jgi:hypothetical protein
MYTHHPKPRNRGLRWTARIWSLPAVLFALAEILFPHGGDAYVPPIEWAALGLQFSAVIGLALAWRWEIVGGALSLITMLSSFVLFVIARGFFPWQAGLLWVGFVIAPAALFLVCGLRSRTTHYTAA